MTTPATNKQTDWQSIHDKVAASACEDSFEVFAKEFWETVVPEKCIWNWHMSVICEEMQKLAEYNFAEKVTPYTLIVNVPPGSSKSSLCSVLFPVWVFIRKPSAVSLCCSYGETLSIHLSIKARQVMKSDKFMRFFGTKVSISKELDRKQVFATNKGGSRDTTSTGGGATGKHADFIIMDDPLKPAEATSEGGCKTSNSWIDSTLLTRKKNKLTTAVIIIMQRLSEMDTTEHFLQKGIPIRHICLPAEITNETDNVKPASLKKFYINNLLDPVRMPKSFLEREYLSIFAYNYAGQYLQSPYPIGDGLFRPENIEIVRIVPDAVDKVIRYWDKAASEKKGCFTAGVKMAILRSGKYLIMDVVRGQWETDRREAIMRQTAQLDGVKCSIVIEQEPGSGGLDSVRASVKNLAGFHVVPDRPSGDKVLRADPMSTQINVGNFMCIQGTWTKEYIHELEAFPNGRNKDMVDASSGAFNYLHRQPIAGTW